MSAWPDRDGITSWSGVAWRGWAPRLPRVTIHRHEHTCLDGTVVVCDSRLITSLGVTLDRWSVAGHSVGVSRRSTPPEEPPDFEWADQRATAAA